MEVRADNLKELLTPLLNERYDNPRVRRNAEIETEQTEIGSSFSLIPFDDGKARVDTYYEDGSPTVYVTIAEESVFEVPLTGKRYTDKAGLDELFSIIDAVICSGVDEETVKHNEKTIKSTIRILVDGQDEPLIISTSNVHNPLLSKTRSQKHYSPYF